MEQITRQQLVSEFGEPGVENPKVIDLITVDPESDKVVLVMIERRRWGQAGQQFKQIEEKINRYLGYALDGFLTEQYPKYQGKQVRIRLDCVEEPQGEPARFVAAAAQAIENEGIEFLVNVTGTPA